MQAVQVDERDVSVEDHHPVFRVHLWSPATHNVHVPPERAGWRNDAYELTYCDVHEAIAWAQLHVAEGGRYELSACYRRDDGRLTAIALAGEPPTRTAP